MTWHNIMAYAHQGIELRPLAGLLPPEHAPTITDTSFKGSDEPRPALLTRKGTAALIAVEHMLDDADHALAPQGGPAASLRPLNDGKGADNRPDTFANADRGSDAAPRGD